MQSVVALFEYMFKISNSFFDRTISRSNTMSFRSSLSCDFNNTDYYNYSKDRKYKVEL